MPEPKNYAIWREKFAILAVAATEGLTPKFGIYPLVQTSDFCIRTQMVHWRFCLKI